MKKLLLFLLVILIYSFLFSQDTWVKTYFPFGEDATYGVEDVFVCNDGGYAINGHYQWCDEFLALDLGYLMKTDSNGNFMWAKVDTVSFLNEFDTISSAFVQTDDSGFLSAVYSIWGGSALIKRDIEGNREWVSNCGNFFIHSMDKTNDGNIILAGRMNGLPTIRKITQSADILWTQDYYIQGQQWSH